MSKNYIIGLLIVCVIFVSFLYISKNNSNKEKNDQLQQQITKLDNALNGLEFLRKELVSDVQKANQKVKEAEIKSEERLKEKLSIENKYKKLLNDYQKLTVEEVDKELPIEYIRYS